jgi:hypothetical protein
MDPITQYRLGQIRQQEILESCQRDQQGIAVKGHAVSLLERVIVLMSAPNSRDGHRQQVARLEYRDNLVTDR